MHCLAVLDLRLLPDLAGAGLLHYFQSIKVFDPGLYLSFGPVVWLGYTTSYSTIIDKVLTQGNLSSLNVLGTLMIVLVLFRDVLWSFVPISL